VVGWGDSRRQGKATARSWGLALVAAFVLAAAALVVVPLSASAANLGVAYWQMKRVSLTGSGAKYLDSDAWEAWTFTKNDSKLERYGEEVLYSPQLKRIGNRAYEGKGRIHHPLDTCRQISTPPEVAVTLRVKITKLQHGLPAKITATLHASWPELKEEFTENEEEITRVVHSAGEATARYVVRTRELKSLAPPRPPPPPSIGGEGCPSA